MLNENKPSVLVTGAASGIGKATADKLLRSGFYVYAFDIKNMDEEENKKAFPCDITDAHHMDSACQWLEENSAELDAIICVAGIHAMTSFVEGDVEKMKKLLDINLFGTIRTVRAFHKFLKPTGRVIIVTSEVAAYDPMPFNGLYNVSKTALECYAQSLRQELNLIGQRVITVRPGATETPLADSTTASTGELAENTELYKLQASRFLGLVNKFKGTPIAPYKIADLIFKAVTKKRPRLVYTKHRSLGLVLLSWLPIRAQCAIIKLLLNKK
jgi:NAD(P)-dependent dehydrogenase (short-subunit alcohol dehydrogenase family)